jgi:glutamate-1-semialdehyde 2,1-aminomutase
LKRLRAIEDERFIRKHPVSRELHAKATSTMLAGVPLSWMQKWPGAFPVYIAKADGSHFTDVDGNSYVDLCLGDTGAMAGHSPAPVVQAIQQQVTQVMSAMLPTNDAAIVSEEMQRRFRLPIWQFTTSATDANRHVIRYCRMLTGRSKIVIIDRCYHGSVDESFATLDDNNQVISRENNVGPPVPLHLTTRVVPFNNVDAMQAALSKEDVACVLMEPAMTNVGIVLPDENYLTDIQTLCHQWGTLLIYDETHTISVGPGGMTGASSKLKPDFITIGKAIGGGISTGAFGMRQAMAEAIQKMVPLSTIDVGGIGGTLAGNALSLAAMRATLKHVLVDDAFIRMNGLAVAWTAGVDAAIKKYGLPWHCSRLGARAEYLFSPRAPRNGKEANDAGDFELEQYIHLRLLNDGFLLTPFHNMALMCPMTTQHDVDAHTAAFAAMCADLVGKGPRARL